MDGNGSNFFKTLTSGFGIQFRQKVPPNAELYVTGVFVDDVQKVEQFLVLFQCL